MLDISLEQTRVYQEAKAEGWKEGQREQKAKMLKVIVPLLLERGMSVEEIAQQLPVDLESVREAVPQSV